MSQSKVWGLMLRSRATGLPYWWQAGVATFVADPEEATRYPSAEDAEAIAKAIRKRSTLNPVPTRITAKERGITLRE